MSQQKFPALSPVGGGGPARRVRNCRCARGTAAALPTAALPRGTAPGSRSIQDARSPAPLPIQDSLSQLLPEARWSLLPLPAPRLKLVPATMRQHGINPSTRDKGLKLGREKDAQARPQGTRGCSRRCQEGAGGVASPGWARALSAGFSTPHPGCAWPPLWATRGKRRKTPSLDMGCGHHCVARVQKRDRTGPIPPLCVDRSGSPSPNLSQIRHSLFPTTLDTHSGAGADRHLHLAPPPCPLRPALRPWRLEAGAPEPAAATEEGPRAGVGRAPHSPHMVVAARALRGSGALRTVDTPHSVGTWRS